MFAPAVVAPLAPKARFLFCRCQAFRQPCAFVRGSLSRPSFNGVPYGVCCAGLPLGRSRSLLKPVWSAALLAAAVRVLWGCPAFACIAVRSPARLFGVRRWRACCFPRRLGVFGFDLQEGATPGLFSSGRALLVPGVAALVPFLSAGCRRLLHRIPFPFASTGRLLLGSLGLGPAPPFKPRCRLCMVMGCPRRLLPPLRPFRIWALGLVAFSEQHSGPLRAIYLCAAGHYARRLSRFCCALR